MSAVVIHRRHGARPAGSRAARRRRSTFHPIDCACCHRPGPADRVRWSTAAWSLAGFLIGLVLVAILTGPAGALLAAGIQWGR